MTGFRLRNLLVLTVLLGVPASAYIFYPTTYRFGLTASVVFDGAAYELKGFEECHYQRVALYGRDHSRIGGPIIDGYRVTTSKDAPSVTLANGQGALVLLWPGTCNSLSNLGEGYLANPSFPFKSPLRAIYLPDRINPQRIWLFSDYRGRISNEPGRLRFRDVTAKLDEAVGAASLQDNAPILWTWHQEQSEARRRAIKQHIGYGGTPQQTWLGLFGCVVAEDEWKNRPEFSAQALSGPSPSRVIIKSGGHDAPCPETRLRHIGLLPSDDLRTATLDLERTDLRWTTIMTPYASEVRDPSEGWWMPEICVNGDGCMGFRMTRPVWIYVPSRKAFVYISGQRFESYDFTNFAMRPGDEE